MINVDDKVSIIIPGFNEGQNIYQNLIKTSTIFSEMFSDFEIIFVNDGSSDNTLEMANQAKKNDKNISVIDYPLNQGKGYALKVGTNEANGKFIIFMDADLELPPTQIPHFFNILFQQNADVVVGSKLHPDSKIDYPPGRKFVSKSYFIVIALLFSQKFHDTQTGLKLFKAEAIKPTMKKVRINRYAFDLEMMLILAKQGYKIVESPIIMEYKRGHNWERIHVKDIVQIIIDTLSILFRYRFTQDYD